MWAAQVFQGTPIQPPVFQPAQALWCLQHLISPVSAPGAAPRAARSPGAPGNHIYCKQGGYRAEQGDGQGLLALSLREV